MLKKIISVMILMLLFSSVASSVSFEDKDSNKERNICKISLNEKRDNVNTKQKINNFEPVEVKIIQPERAIYLSGNKIIGFFKPLIVGPIKIKCEITSGNASRVEFYIDDELKRIIYEEPFEWLWDETDFLSHTIMVKAYGETLASGSDELDVSYFNFGSPSDISKDEAIDILIDNVIDPDTLDHIVYAFTLDETLKNGDKSSPWLPHPTPKTTQKAPSPNYRTTTENEWFFWIDDYPRARFSHPTRYVYIDAKTAEIEINDERWWPILNDEAIFCADGDYWDSENWAYTNDNNPPSYEKNSKNKVTDPKKAILDESEETCGCLNGDGECAIIIDGNDGEENDADGMATDAIGMGIFFGTYPGFNTQELNSWSDNNSQDDIEDAFDNTEDCDDCVVYVVAHGGVADDGEPYVSCDGDLVYQSEFEDMASENPDTEYKWIFDCCHSGSFIESLSKLDNSRKVITASDKCQTSYGDIDDNDFIDPPPNHPDPNPDDEGGEFTSGFVEDLWDIWYDDPNIDIVELLDKAFESACEKDVCALNGITDPQVWEREPEDNTAPKNHITTPGDGDNVESPLLLEGYATDFGGTGIVLLDFLIEWDSGFYEGDELLIDPPSAYVEYTLGPVDLSNFIEPGENIKFTTYATDDADNTGEDSVTVTWILEEEDNTPPVTEKIIGEPNEEGGYIIWPYTPITLIATDPEPGSGVNYIYYEIAWDNNGDGIWDQLFEETVYEDTAEIYLDEYGIFWGEIELRWYAVDNAGNAENMHYQRHLVMEY